MICGNCGGMMEQTDAVCPFCGAMNPEGAERKFMGKLYDMETDLRKEQPIGALKRTAAHSMKWMALCMVLVAVVVIVAHQVSRGVEAAQDKRWEERNYEKILWEDQCFQWMDTYYEEEDLEGILNRLEDEGAAVYQVYDWEHSALLEAYALYRDCLEAERAFQEDSWDWDYLPYEVERGFISAMTLTRLSEDSFRERLEAAGDADAVREYARDAERILTEVYGASAEELDVLARDAKMDGYQDSTVLRDYVDQLEERIMEGDSYGL